MLKKIEKIEVPTECWLCERSLNNDPYKLTYDTKEEVVICNHCYDGLVELELIPDKLQVNKEE